MTKQSQRQRSVPRAAYAALALGASLTLVVSVFMTNLDPVPRFFMGLMFGSAVAFPSYAKWQSESPSENSAVTRAAVITAAVMITSVAVLLIPLL